MSRFPTAVPHEAWSRLNQIGKADLLVGIPSYNNAKTIGHVVRMAAEGMATHFPDLKGVVVNADGGSIDGTREMVESVAAQPQVQKLSMVYQGLPGKGSAFRAVFEAARSLGVRACVVVDSDLRSITPDWIRLLAGPVLQGRFGYVAPYYLRHKYDGTITNSIAYPLTAALYGVAVRQPIGGDFGFSGALLDRYLNQDVWETDVASFGVDIWMTTTALNEGFEVAQAPLGAKVHDPKDPAASLGPMFRQVVGTLFGLMGQYSSSWPLSTRLVQAPLLGEVQTSEPEPVQVNVSAMIERFKAGLADGHAILSGVAAEETVRVLKEISGSRLSQYGFPLDLWVSLVYDFAVAYNQGGMDKRCILDALTGLYYGRTASFCLETANMSTAETEDRVISQVVRRFMELKPYLLSRWPAGLPAAPER